MFFIEFVFVFLKVTARVAVNVIIIIIFWDFIINGLLYVFYEFLAVHKKAEVCFNIILLAMVAAVF